MVGICEGEVDPMRGQVDVPIRAEKAEPFARLRVVVDRPEFHVEDVRERGRSSDSSRDEADHPDQHTRVVGVGHALRPIADAAHRVSAGGMVK